MTSILSSGYGRLHLAQSAEYLGRAGVDVKLVCGWMPKNPDSWLVRLCSKIVGRNLAPGLRKRAITLAVGGEVCSCAWADFMCNALFIADRKIFKGRYHHPIAEFAWSVFGWQTKRIIKRVANDVLTQRRRAAEKRKVKAGKCESVRTTNTQYNAIVQTSNSKLQTTPLRLCASALEDCGAVFHVRSGAGQGGAIKLAKRRGMKVLVDHSALHPAQTETNLKADCERWGEPLPIAPNAGVWKNVLKDCAEADILMVNANHIRDSFVERGFDPKKIRVVYLGVRDDFQDVRIRQLESGKKNDVAKVLFTGNFSPLKGAEYLLESLRILNERGIKVHYDVVGAVSAPKAMLEHFNAETQRRRADTLNSKLQTSNLPITFHGPVPQDDLKAFLSESDIYLFPSLADGCAQSGMEALTAGLPVVATYQSGLPITDGETGCVVPMKDAAAIADKIEWLIAHPEERERLGRNAAKMMRENYTWEKYAENVKGIYKEMVKEG